MAAIWGSRQFVVANGLVGDNVADDTAAINDALDFAFTNKRVNVYLPPAAVGYKITDTIHVGRGTGAYHTVMLIGDEAPSYQNSTNGVKLYPTHTNKPVINIQGARGSGVRGLGIKGLNYTHLSTFTRPNAAQTSDPADWLDPTITTGLDRYRPYAAITVDAYGGTAPANSYSGTFGKNMSSGMVIENCHIQGFAVAIIVQPSDTDSNGDFLLVHNCHIDYCTYGIAVCNSQSRNVSVRDLKYALVHTLLTNGYFGRQVGKFGGVLDNISGGYSYQTFDILSGSYWGNTAITNLYFEMQARIGKFANASSFNAPISFRNCEFAFDEANSHTSTDGLIETDYFGSFEFDGCTFTGHKRMANIFSGSGNPSAIIKNCNFQGVSEWWPSGSGFSATLGRAISYSPGGVLPGSATIANNRLEMIGASRGISYDPGTTTFRERRYGPVIDHVQNRGICHIGARETVDSQGRSYRISERREPVLLPLSNASIFTVGVAVTGDTVTFRYSKDYHETNATAYAMEPGDLLLFITSGTICAITAVAVNADTHYDVTAKIMSNYTHDGAGNITATADLDSDTGNLQLYHTGQYVGRTIYYGDFASGSASVTNVARGDGYGGDVSTFLAVGDFLALPVYNDSYYTVPYPKRTKISAITDNAGGGTVTLDRNATATKRFPILPVLLG